MLIQSASAHVAVGMLAAKAGPHTGSCWGCTRLVLAEALSYWLEERKKERMNE